MSTAPYFLRNPALDDMAPAMMAAPAPQMMAPPQPVDPTHAMTAPLGPTHDAQASMMQAMQPQAPTGAPGEKASKAEAPKKTMSPIDQEEEHLNANLMGKYQQDADPYGSPDNHPGFFGKLLHGLNVATGGVNRRQMEEQGLSKQIQGIEEEKSKEGLEGAQAGNANAAAAKSAEETSEMPGKTTSEEGLQGATAGNLASEAASRDEARINPSLVVGHARAVNKALQEGRDPANDPIVQAYEDSMQRTQKQAAAPKESTPQAQTFDDLVAGGMSKEDALKRVETKPAPIRVETPGEERGQKNDLLKAYQPTLDSAERMNVMTESYEKAVKDHDQQAMLNLLANHLGMTMGLQKGARMTKDIVTEAKNSQPWLAGMQSKFDKDGYLSGVTLSPNQMRQMVALGQSRYAEDAKKSRSTAQYLGAKDDGPARVPGKATINYYLGLTGGDPQRAKALAAQDGWSQ